MDRQVLIPIIPLVRIPAERLLANVASYLLPQHQATVLIIEVFVVNAITFKGILEEKAVVWVVDDLESIGPEFRICAH